MLTLRTLRARRGASLTEYAVLSGVLGAVVIGSVLTLGGEAVQGTETGTAALQNAFYVAEAPAPVAPPSGGGVEGEGEEDTLDPFGSCFSHFQPNPLRAHFVGGPISSIAPLGPELPLTYAIAPSSALMAYDSAPTGYTLAVLEAGADAVVSWETGNRGLVVLPDGRTVDFSGYDRVFLCETGVEVQAPPPPPVPALFGWYQGATADVPLALWSDTTATANATAIDVGTSAFGRVSRAVSANLQIDPAEPFVRSSALNIRVGDAGRTVATSFSTPVDNATFRIAGFDSFNSASGVRTRDEVVIRGITPMGDIVYPTTSSSFVSSIGGGTFLGNTLTCSGACASALFTFDEPVSLIHFTKSGVPGLTSGGGTTVVYSQVWISDIAGQVVLE